MSSSKVAQDSNRRDALWHAATATVGLRAYRKLARRTGLVESYQAVWQYAGGCFDPRGMVRVRVHRFRVRATIKAEVFAAWEDAPSEVKRRFLTATEWQSVLESVDAAGFWRLPSRHTPSSCGLHGDTWTIEGFRKGRFHSVRRTRWSILDGVGDDVFRLGKSLAKLAGVSLRDDAES